MAVLLVLGWGLTALWNAPLFAIHHLEVSGINRLSRESVLSSAAVPAEATLLKLPVEAITQRLLDDPWISQVRIIRRFPSTLELAVVERTVAVAVRVRDGVWLVSSDGYWLEYAGATPTTTVPVVGGPNGVKPVAGESVSSPEITNTLAVLQGLSSELRSQVTSVSASTVDQTTLVLKGPIEVLVGSSDDIAKKDQIIRGILAGQKSVVYINVRLTDKPTWRGLGN